mmetsp:Transcript_29246/g.80129  ORF Transcript_29246/g.80129 Transcript_29246/m.80129 type:complete len:273 (+) Transcript_29246:96-914(+)
MAAGQSVDEENGSFLESGTGQQHIEDESGFIDWCSPCLGSRFKVVFGDADKDVLWQLRRRLVNNPRPADPELHQLFLGMWNTAFPEEKRSAFEVGSHWKRLGFQGKDPKTDVRTGAWAVSQMSSFAQHYPVQFREMAAEAGEGSPTEHSFALACLNVSHMIAMFFDLVTCVSVSPLPGATRASKRQLRNLTALIANECLANGFPVNSDVCQRVMDELFVEVMSHVHRSWVQLATSAGGATLFDFPKALRSGFDANAAFWRRPCRDLGALKLC